MTHCFIDSQGRTSFAIPANVTRLPCGFFGHTRSSQGRSYAVEEYIPIRVDCELKEHVRYATASLVIAGEVPLPGTCEVMHIDAVRHRGRIAACVGPLFTGSLPEDWVTHHTDIGVERVYNFVPSGIEFMDGKYNTHGVLPDRVLEHLHGYAPFKPEPVSLSPQPAVENLLYSPPATSFYFGQVAMMHACWYMQRYSHEFILAIDADEYLWMNSTAINVPDSLGAWLNGVPLDAATVALHRYTYPKACQVHVKDPPSRASRRIETPHFQGKMILRPQDVIEATVHGPRRVKQGMHSTVHDPSQGMFLKHIREGVGHIYGITGCEGLVDDKVVKSSTSVIY